VPSSGFGNNGVLIFTVPIFDPFGQKFVPGCNGLGNSGVNVAVRSG
jgi:hypothetical protein